MIHHDISFDLIDYERAPGDEGEDVNNVSKCCAVISDCLARYQCNSSIYGNVCYYIDIITLKMCSLLVHTCQYERYD